MAADFELIPLYGQQPIVRNRTSAALNFWAGQTLAVEIPEEKPDEEWVRARILATRVTSNTSGHYLDMSLAYYTQQDAIQSSMRDLMDGFPTQAERDVYTNSIMVPVTPAVTKAMAAADVSDDAVKQWYEQNGFPEPEPPAPAPSVALGGTA